jgi:HK97 gp10 family phage protein
MSQPLSIQIDGLDDFINDVKKAHANSQPLVRAALQNSATKIQHNVRGHAPHKTGALQRSVLTTVNYPSAKVTVEESYGRYVEDGTRPHLITPKNKKALFWKGALNPYKSVKHPGTKANPFFQIGVEESILYVQEQFVKVSEKLITTMAGHR